MWYHYKICSSLYLCILYQYDCIHDKWDLYTLELIIWPKHKNCYKIRYNSALHIFYFIVILFIWIYINKKLNYSIVLFVQFVLFVQSIFCIKDSHLQPYPGWEQKLDCFVAPIINKWEVIENVGNLNWRNWNWNVRV